MLFWLNLSLALDRMFKDRQQDAEDRKNFYCRVLGDKTSWCDWLRRKKSGRDLQLVKLQVGYIFFNLQEKLITSIACHFNSQ